MMTGHDVLDAIDWLAGSGIAAWIDGGWGIDALLGQQTRPHDDLDLVIDDDQINTAIETLAAQGFSLHIDQRPISFVLRDECDRRIDFHPVCFDARGGWQAQPDATDFLYTHDGLSGTGSIDGRPVRCVTAEFQVRCHLGYDPDADDFHDMRLLRDRFGVTLPSPYDH
jgi:lincosamide nucleotidyltransferase A/C/D/E